MIHNILIYLRCVFKTKLNIYDEGFVLQKGFIADVRLGSQYASISIHLIFSDGGNRSGTFIACMNALDQVKIEQATDIFQIVRRLKLVRPQFVETLVRLSI